MKSRSVKAIVRVVLEIEASSAWSSTCSFDQVCEQAEVDIEHMIASGNMIALGELPRRLKSLRTISVEVAPIN